MRTRIRFITKSAGGTTEHSEKLVNADAITIGRATDQILHLQDRRARLQHAVIRRVNDEFRISTGALAGVTVNGRSQRDVSLEVGDVIEVGANLLRVIEAEPGADFALSFELSGTATSDDLATAWTAAPTGVAGFSKRQLAWLLIAAILVIGFLLPATGLLHTGAASMLRGSVLLPDDGWWLAGPVHNAHSATSTQCESCHTQVFRRVPDEACLACHSADRHVAAPSQAVLGERRCAGCHLEHNEPQQLVNQHQQLCGDCHARLPADVPLQAAEDFLDAHPDFRVSLNVPVATAGGETEWRVEHVSLKDSAAAERSNLSFDHAEHLNPEGILTPAGRRVMDCVDCHQLETGGARMRPVAMDEHCSDCHTLGFDANDPSRTVPHGDPEGVVRVLVEYYSARLLGDDTAAVGQRLRRPGQALSRADRDRVGAEARAQAMTVAADLFERRACVNCHVVTATSEASMPWRVEPVRLTSAFFSHANFSHAAHDTAASCDSCHDASASTGSHDVLIPAIETCRECHGSAIARRNTASQIPSTCIMCHSFHFPAKGVFE